VVTRAGRAQQSPRRDHGRQQRHRACRTGLAAGSPANVANDHNNQKLEEIMMQKLFAVGLGIAFGVGGMAVACHQKDGESVKVITAHDIQEKLDGKEAMVTAVEVTIAPGESGLSHRHPGPGFVYVLEGEYELGIDDQPTKILKAGETFYEPTGCLHRVSKNPAAQGKTRLIAFVLHPRDARNVAIPEHAHK
jgi:quercetin dioxygenase-like cupin family protein